MKISRLVPASVVLLGVSALADEGLWPYNQFPRAAILEKHGFDATPAFIDRLRAASVRIGGQSGAFVSPLGLILTSRAAAGACLSNSSPPVSAPARDLMQDGYAGTPDLPCPDLDASVLLKTTDVTAHPDLRKAGQSLAQRNAAIARIEKECAETTKNACAVVRLFAGGRYDLYEYRRYTDVRLVFAPEYTAAFFGKERDSISYLRYGLNIAFLRAYEDGKPAATPGFLHWSPEGVNEGDLVFATGNPRPTARSVTAAQLTFLRDTALPAELARLLPRIRQLSAFAAQSEEQARLAQPTLAPLLAAFKTEAGKLIGLRDDRLVTRKTTFEQKIRRAVENDSKLGPPAPPAAKVWDEVAAAYRKWAPFEKSYQVLEGNPAPGSELFRRARAAIRGEKPGPAAAPPNPSVEILMLTQFLEELKDLGEKDLGEKDLGKKEAPLKSILAGRTARQAAEAMVKADDGVAHLAALLEPAAGRLRRQHDETIGALETSAAEKIAQYRFKLFGAADYPDGTSTPRVEFGVVSGYTDRAAVPQPFASTFSGLFYRTNNDGPWQVAKKWLDSRPALREVTPLDFVSTCDTGGGDYGGPVVNRTGELVGVTFDGNLESLPNVFLYTGEQARSVHVDARGIAEALDKVYGAGALLEELGLRRLATGP